MKRLVIALCCLISIPSLFAQSGIRILMNEEGKAFFMPRFRQFRLKIPETSYTYSYTPASTFKLEEPDLLKTQADIYFLSDERPMNMQILSGAYKPFFNPYTPMLRRVNPFAFDFFETASYTINENIDFTITGFESTYPGVGRVNIVHSALGYHLNKWEIWGGGVAGRFATPFTVSPGIMTGIDGGVNYNVTESFKLKTWGQYLIYDQRDKNIRSHFINERYKESGIGGAMEFKIKNNFNFGFHLHHSFR